MRMRISIPGKDILRSSYSFFFAVWSPGAIDRARVQEGEAAQCHYF
jgi:hypothetical protein